MALESNHLHLPIQAFPSPYHCNLLIVVVCNQFKYSKHTMHKVLRVALWIGNDSRLTASAGTFLFLLTDVTRAFLFPCENKYDIIPGCQSIFTIHRLFIFYPSQARNKRLPWAITPQYLPSSANHLFPADK